MVRGEPRQEAGGGLADALAHALVDRDDLAPALRADADGDEDARVCVLSNFCGPFRRFF